MVKKPENKLVVGLDIGTSKVVAIVGEISIENEVEVIGIGSHPSRGLKKGVVVNIESTVQSIQRAIEEAELMAGCEIHSVYAGIAGGHIRSLNSHGIVAIRDSEVGHNDVERVIDAARAGTLGEWTIAHDGDVEIGQPAPLSVSADIAGTPGAVRAAVSLDPRLAPGGRADLMLERGQGVWTAQTQLVPQRRGTAPVDTLWLAWDGPWGLGSRQQRITQHQLFGLHQSHQSRQEKGATAIRR